MKRVLGDSLGGREKQCNEQTSGGKRKLPANFLSEGKEVRVRGQISLEEKVVKGKCRNYFIKKKG